MERGKTKKMEAKTMEMKKTKKQMSASERIMRFDSSVWNHVHIEGVRVVVFSKRVHLL